MIEYLIPQLLASLAGLLFGSVLGDAWRNTTNYEEITG